MKSSQLGKIRTVLASDRTFLSMIRTNAIFIGLSVLMAKNGYSNISKIILTVAALCIFYITCSYYNQKKKLIAKYYLDFDIYFNYLNFIYALLIFFIILILLFDQFGIIPLSVLNKVMNKA
ncbi:hypothetical protein CPAV1605_615 [seawater metagenome]|uniref:DUF202 domain-containing protein n=1 Tax=seawater metagenome TaxID=1561972 RepID=A0A5E8CM63_9ZZZZ